MTTAKSKELLMTDPSLVPELEAAIRRHITVTLGKHISDTSPADVFHAVSHTIKDLVVQQMIKTEEQFRAKDGKRVYYLSMEFLIGRTLKNNLINLGLLEQCREAVRNLQYDFDEVVEEEPDPALGNGGLGRLAACFLDSLATQGLPGIGYGINYQFGLFKQVIENGFQKEKPDRWLSDAIYWQIMRLEKAIQIPIYGRVIKEKDSNGHPKSKWVDTKFLMGVPHDMPIVSYGGKTVNFLRLYSARTSDDFQISIFNQGDYMMAVQDKILSETVSKVLYPSDSNDQGRELRLIQGYFFAACALKDIIRRYLYNHDNFILFPSKVAIQLNDTHPTIAIAELMRLFLDEHHMSWEQAWDITVKVFGFTNHTLLPEALEKWPIYLFEKVLPRHLEIIYDINDRFLKIIKKKWPGDEERLRRMSIFEEGFPKHVRMAHLAIVGSHSINGVAKLHSELVKTKLVPDFFELWPDRFNNKTNGVTPRRWIATANPALATLFDQYVGPEWITDLFKLKQLESYAEDEVFCANLSAVKKGNKERLAKFVEKNLHIPISIDTLFDSQAKRIHLYKRQLLNILKIIHLYLKLVDENIPPLHPLTFFFSGKAAPGYRAAKDVIKLIHNVGEVINQDSKAKEWLSVVFIPDYRVTIAELIVPATDLSEQISTAGMEASGTGNMKFAMNGALTIGTLDGANIEIKDSVGEENIFTFGLKADEVFKTKEQKTYHPGELYHQKPFIRRIIDALKQNRFSSNEPGLFDGLLHHLMDDNDPFVHLADLEDYIETHQKACQLYLDQKAWAKKVVYNIANMGPFSSDRAILEYARDIWHIL